MGKPLPLRDRKISLGLQEMKGFSGILIWDRNSEKTKKERLGIQTKKKQLSSSGFFLRKAAFGFKKAAALSTAAEKGAQGRGRKLLRQDRQAYR